MKSEIYFSLKTPLNIEVRTTLQYWGYLVTFKHPIMKSKEDIVRCVLQMLNWKCYMFWPYAEKASLYKRAFAKRSYPAG